MMHCHTKLKFCFKKKQDFSSPENCFWKDMHQFCKNSSIQSWNLKHLHFDDNTKNLP